MVFAAHTLALLYFFATVIVIEECICKKNKQVQPDPSYLRASSAKNNAIKKWGELLKHKVAL
jgi:hypothetical protein